MALLRLSLSSNLTGGIDTEELPIKSPRGGRADDGGGITEHVGIATGGGVGLSAEMR